MQSQLKRTILRLAMACLVVMMAFAVAVPARATTWKEDWSAAGFFKWVAQESSDEAVVQDANAALDLLKNGTGSNVGGIQNHTDLKDRSGASSLLNMYAAANAIEYSNTLRAKHGAAALGTNCQMMAISILQCNETAVTFANTGMLMHCQAYMVAENISMGYSDPFDGWYVAEKKLYDAGTTDFSQVGHYLNIIDPSYIISGFAYNTNNTIGEQSFSYSSTVTYSVDDYLDLLVTYINKMVDEQGMPVGNWVHDANGWWYRKIDGSYPKGGIARIEGKDYCFDGNGYMRTGWVKVDGKWYYFESSGAMAKNKWVDDCYVGSDGAMLVNTTTPDGVKVGADGKRVKGSSSSGSGSGKVKAGWKQSGSRWWYQNADGTYPKSQFAKIGGATYYFDGSGWMVTGWKKVSGSWYYFASSGKMATGWLKSGGSWYFMGSDGKMATGWSKQGSTWYYLNSSGVMATGWKKIDGFWYLFNSSGAMTKGWQKASGSWYWLDSKGRMVTGWKDISNKRYWFSSSGVMATGWKKISGSWYYFGTSGAMAKNTWIGKDHVDANGVWDKSK